MTENVLNPYPYESTYRPNEPIPVGGYVLTTMQPQRPRFNPYVVRREQRLLLCVPGDDAKPVRTFELDPVELTRLLVGAHEALKGYTLEAQGGV